MQPLKIYSISAYISKYNSCPRRNVSDWWPVGAADVIAWGNLHNAKNRIRKDRKRWMDWRDGWQTNV